MRADVHERVDALDLAQPEVERDIAVTGRERRVVVVVRAGRGPAAVGLQRDEGAAEPEIGEMEGAFNQGFVFRGIAPARRDAARESFGQRAEKLAIAGDGKAAARCVISRRARSGGGSASA